MRCLYMQEIGRMETIAVNDMAFLHLECERLIERYSARDDLSADNPELWKETQADMLSETAEDLEGFLDLLSMCKLSFEITAPRIVDILNILEAQLESQLMIVDTVLDMKAEEYLERQEHQAIPALSKSSNIIQFPVQN